MKYDLKNCKKFQNSERLLNFLYYFYVTFFTITYLVQFLNANPIMATIVFYHKK